MTDSWENRLLALEDRFEAQVKELRNAVSSLEWRVSNSRSFALDASRVDVDEFTAASRVEPQRTGAAQSSQERAQSSQQRDPSLQDLFGGFCLGAQCEQTSQGSNLTPIRDYQVVEGVQPESSVLELDWANWKLEMDEWKVTVTSHMQALEKRISEMDAVYQKWTPSTETDRTPPSSRPLSQPSSQVLQDSSYDQRGRFSSAPDFHQARARTLETDAASIKAQDAKRVLKAARREIENDFYQLHESVYDCALLVFTDLIYLEDTLAVLFGIVVSVTIQITLLIIIVLVEIEDPHRQQEHALRWRHEHAHDAENMIIMRNVSLAHAVCEPDSSLPISLYQWASVYRIRVYTEDFLGLPIPQGITMIMMVLVLWLCDILQEIRDCIKQTCALSTIPYGCWGRLRVEQIEGGKFRVAYLQGVRVVFLMSICLTRLGVGSALCWIGCRWLVQTEDLKDLLLDAISLSFIVNVDETMFAFLASDEVKWMISRMAPLTWNPSCFRHRTRRNHFGLPIIMCLIGIILWIVFMAKFVLPYLENLRIIERNYCGGQQDFVVRRDDNSSFIRVEATNPNSELVNVTVRDLVRETVGL